MIDINADPGELITDVLYQIGALEAFCRRHLCVHGDTPGAVSLARELRAVLSARTVEVASFA